MGSVSGGTEDGRGGHVRNGSLASMRLGRSNSRASSTTGSLRTLKLSGIVAQHPDLERRLPPTF
jgi:hypothetical protein